jgi:dipeptidyl aminopeptidase/acylaminoacyl peptidase
VHGTEDKTVPFTQAEIIRDTYDNNGVPYEFHPLDGEGHSPWQATVDGKSLLELAFDFIVKTQKLNLE